jgi:hypothetical protein
MTYAGLFLVVFLPLALWIGHAQAPRFPPALGADTALVSRVKYYRRHAREYSVIFLGDSRVYCAMHPEIIERYLPGMRGLNLSNFTNWFSTQHSIVRDIARKIPAGTIVVWSVALSNFSDEGAHAIQRVYPVSFSDASRLLWWGHGSAIGGLFDNLAYYHWPLYLPIALRDVHARIDTARRMPFVAAGRAQAASMQPAAPAGPRAAEVDTLVAEAERLRADAVRNPDVSTVTIPAENGRPNSVVIFFRRGGYYRIEIDPAFFRGKQAEMAKAIGPVDATTYRPALNPLRWKLFTTMLDVFAEHHVRLIVNEVEEAPYTYGTADVREKARQAMRERVQPAVEQRGFVYARADLDALHDADYFDYNHLNSEGIAKYSPMIAAIIGRELRP